MKTYTYKLKLLLLFPVLSLSGMLFAQKEYQKRLQTQMINAADGSVINLESGKFAFSGSISLEGKKNIIIRGKGMDKTILSFKNQIDGAEGLRISNCENILVENLTIQDAKGDCIKAQHVKSISFKNTKVEWTGKPKTENGAYGFYPVECDGVTIEKCVAIGSSDAGFYVGQSKNIVVKDNLAFHNVVGYEIENCINSEVYNNTAYDNAAGMFILDLPKVVQKKGGNTKVYNNYLHDNNYVNFAPIGNIVDKVPSGTGFMILAASNVEFYNNKVINNKTMSCGIISYLATGLVPKDPEYDPFPKSIYIHNNNFIRKPQDPTYEGMMGQMFQHKLKFGKDVPHILFDGILNPSTLDAKGNLKPEYTICIKNNKNGTFANMDIPNDFKNISKDLTKYDCER